MRSCSGTLSQRTKRKDCLHSTQRSWVITIPHSVSCTLIESGRNCKKLSWCVYYSPPLFISDEHHSVQQLLTMTRDRDNILNDNDDLRHELDLYTSVVPAQSKPRTAVTRVTRAPLANSNINARSAAYAKSTSTASSGAKKRDPTPETEWNNLEYKEGDMTIDEIL